jgi:HlyD family secretion protein
MAVAMLAAACTARHDGIRASGTIEMDEIDVASMVGGRIVRLAVDEGDTVAVGDTIAVLDRGEVIAELEAQTAQAARAEAQLRDVQAGPRRAEVLAARADLDAASAQAELARVEMERIDRLHDRDLASAAELDRARTNRDATVARRNAVAEQMRLLQQGARRGQIEAAAQAADAALAQVAAARTRSSELVLTSPLAGVVLLRNFEPGELALVGLPVVTLGNPDRLWMRCFVAAPLLPRVKRGAVVEVTVDGVKHSFRGRVVEIANQAEFTPRSALTEEERANLVFGVKIALDSSGGTLKPGLPATARILEAAP